MLSRCFGVLAALALLSAAPAGPPVDAYLATAARVSQAQDAVSAKGAAPAEHSQATLCQRADGDDTPDPPVCADARIPRLEKRAHRTAKPWVGAVCLHFPRAAFARGPPSV
jgi:hypothetical protein